MGKASAVVHAHPGLKHQVIYGEALVKGLRRHGIQAEVVRNANAEADIHVMMGPWFAFKQWRYHPRALYLDRAYWGDPKCVSVHWLRHGEKVFTHLGRHRHHPDTKPYKSGDRVIVLADYDTTPDYDGPATVRQHPARHKEAETLKHALERHDVAIGGRTTALVDAALMGLKVITDDMHSPVWPISGQVNYVARALWLEDLAWHNWSLDEIENGAYIDALGGFDDAR